jgi:hypothetical protein
MHRFASPSVVTRFKIAGLLFILGALMIPVVIGILVYSIMTDDMELTKISIVLVALTVLVAILQFTVGLRTRCPLCMTPVLASKGCSKHRHARSLLGSYRLRVALSIFSRNSFRCPYCNESAEMEVRSRNQSGRSRRK